MYEGKEFKSLQSAYCFSDTDTAAALSTSFQELPEQALFISHSIFGKDCLLPECGGPCTTRIIEMPLSSQISILANAQSTLKNSCMTDYKCVLLLTPSLNPPKIYSPAKVIPGDFIAQLFCLLKQVITSGVLKCQCLCRVFLF